MHTEKKVFLMHASMHMEPLLSVASRVIGLQRHRGRGERAAAVYRLLLGAQLTVAPAQCDELEDASKDLFSIRAFGVGLCS